MLDYGADPNLANDDGLTALHQVSLTDYFLIKFLKLLLCKQDSTDMNTWQLFSNLLHVCLAWLSKLFMFVLSLGQIELL